MATRITIPVSGAVEVLVDQVVLERLLAYTGLARGPLYGRNGKQHLRRAIAGYNNAARHRPWIVLVDLDHDAACAPTLRAAWLPNPAPQMCFRVAVREVEAWLLADRERLARYLGVATSRVPADPEALDNPKRTLVDLARRARRDIQADMVPRPGSGRAEGPAYVTRLIEFVTEPERGWRPEVAAASADSLRRCLNHLSLLARATS